MNPVETATHNSMKRDASRNKRYLGDNMKRSVFILCSMLFFLNVFCLNVRINAEKADTKDDSIEATSFESLTSLLSHPDHPVLYDSEEDAKDFYQNAPEGTVIITTWSQSLTEYFDHEPEYSVLWLDGNPLDLGSETSTIGFVTIDFSSLEEKVSIDTAMELADSFIPHNIYKQNGKKEKYVSVDEAVDNERRTCWVVYYDTLVDGIDRHDFAILIFGESDGIVKKSICSFSENNTPGERYILVDWDTGRILHKETQKDDFAYSESDVVVSEKSLFTPIGYGESGDSVVDIQKQLAALGFLFFPVDGEYGRGTEQAVIDFQKANQLEPTGTVDEETYKVMFSADEYEPEHESKQESESFIPIKRGDLGDPVIIIQERLAELGYLTSPADGEFGPSTEQAVINFQNANQMDESGIVDERTYNNLFSSGAIKNVVPILKSDVEESTSDVGTRSVYDALVWIPNSGSKYHSYSGCSGMINPSQVSRSQAEAMGYTPCSKCY